MTQFESYTLDQFPLRDPLRTLKALSALYVYQLSDNNDYYVSNGVISHMDYVIHDESVEFASGRLQTLYDEKLKDKANNIYFAAIPDKNTFTAPDSGHLSLDNDAFIGAFREKLSFAEYIDILPLLSLEDYYATDTHWRQESIVDVAQALAQAMGTTLPDEYTTNTSEHPFYGVYYGQAALPLAPDSLHWLTNSVIDGLTAYNHGTQQAQPIYALDKLTGKDPYEVFLTGGKTAPITITNPHATTDKELVIFRDSFTSSIAPLLAQGYKTVTLIDLRETMLNSVDRVVDFEGKDVLFLYSTLVLNNNIEGGEKFK
ncbi:MAG: hypothetical protein E7553_00235 [Ruminococcaceae bacterium]|nr:hypothetical protein [Oscillospiraceae bacterium]